MNTRDRKSRIFRILAIVLCLSIVVFFSALLMHHHGINGHADHCQICILGHATPYVAAVLTLLVTMQMLLLARLCAPSRGSPTFLALPTTRPPPALL
jgi:hypothetical protein